MSQQMSATGSITLRRLRSGDSVQFSLATSNRSLFQIIGDSGQPQPNFSTLSDSERPKIYPRAVSSRNNTITFTDVKYYLDDALIAVSTSGGAMTIQSGYTNYFKSAGNFAILVTGNKFTKTSDIYTHTIRCDATIMVGSNEESMTATIDYELRRLSVGTYWAKLVYPSGLIVDEKQSSITMTPELYSSEGKIDASKYTVKWFKTEGNTDTPISTDKTLSVTTDMVNGAAHFYCELYIGGNKVEAVGETVYDNSDQYQIVFSGKDQLEPGSTFEIKIQVEDINSGTIMENLKDIVVTYYESEGLNKVTPSGASLLKETSSGSLLKSATAKLPVDNMTYNGQECSLVLVATVSM